MLKIILPQHLSKHRDRRGTDVRIFLLVIRLVIETIGSDIDMMPSLTE